MCGEIYFESNGTSACFPRLIVIFVGLTLIILIASVIWLFKNMLFFIRFDFLVFMAMFWILVFIFSFSVTYIIQPYDVKPVTTIEEQRSEVRKKIEKMREMNPRWRSDLVSYAILCMSCFIWIILVPVIFTNVHFMDLILGFVGSALFCGLGLGYGWRQYKYPLKKMDVIYEKLLQLEEFSDITFAGVLSEVFNRPVDKSDVRPYILRLIDDEKIECIQTGLYRIIGQEN